MSDVEVARKRVRQLLLSGDNTLKHREDPESRGRARARFEQALALADEADLDDGIHDLIRRRLVLLEAVDAA